MDINKLVQVRSERYKRPEGAFLIMPDCVDSKMAINLVFLKMCRYVMAKDQDLKEDSFADMQGYKECLYRYTDFVENFGGDFAVPPKKRVKWNTRWLDNIYYTISNALWDLTDKYVCNLISEQTVKECLDSISDQIDHMIEKGVFDNDI